MLSPQSFTFPSKGKNGKPYVPWIAASRIMLHPLASQAAGTVSQTSAESAMKKEAGQRMEDYDRIRLSSSSLTGNGRING